MRLDSALPVFLLALGVAGCATPTERALLDAQSSLDDCDMRAAHDAFDQAYALSEGDDLRATLGFALTDLMLMVEDPAVTEVVRDVGFSRGVNAETFLYGDDGLFHMLATEPRCDARNTWLETHVPYPAITFNSDVDPVALVSPTLTAQDLVDAAMPLAARFERVARALEAAGDAMDEPFLLEPSEACGGGQLASASLQRPELYTAAAVLESARAILLLVDGYDWDVAVVVPWTETDSAIVDAANAHVFRLTDATSVARAQDALLHSVDLALKALDAVDGTTDFPAEALFDWTRFDPVVLSDMQSLVSAARDSLADPGTVDIPMWTPALGVDLNAYFADPPDAGSISQDLFVLDMDYVDANYDVLDALLFKHFTRDPLNSQFDEYFNASDAWDRFDLEPVLNPRHQLDAVATCEYDFPT